MKAETVQGKGNICITITKISFASPYSVVFASSFRSSSDYDMEFRCSSGYEPEFRASSGCELEIYLLEFGTASQIWCRNRSAELDRSCKSDYTHAPGNGDHSGAIGQRHSKKGNKSGYLREDQSKVEGS